MNKKLLIIVITSFLAVLILLFGISVLVSGFEIPFLTTSRVKTIFIYPAPNNGSTYTHKKPVDFVFYFHGAGCTEKLIVEPFYRGGLNLVEFANIYRKDLIFVSFGYNTRRHWSSPEVTKDTIKKIREIVNKFNTRKIMFIGVSMGGSLALNVLSVADQKLKDLISGVISAFPIIDYQYTISHTKRKNIYDALKEDFSKYKEPLNAMRLSSPATYISGVPDHTKIILIEALMDTHVPPKQIEDYYSELVKLKKDVVLLKYDTDHLPVEKEYRELVTKFLG